MLSDLVETYETTMIPMRPVGDVELLHSLIEHKNVTQSEVASSAGIAESTISEVLAGKRKLNQCQIAKLARYFDIDPVRSWQNKYDMFVSSTIPITEAWQNQRSSRNYRSN